MSWVHFTCAALFGFALMMFIHHRALRIGRRSGLDEAIKIAQRHMHKQSKVSRSVHEIVVLIEEERDGYTKEHVNA